MTVLFRALFGLLVWAAHFSLLYAIHTIVCLLDIPLRDRSGAMIAASVLLTIGALAVLAWFFIARWRERGQAAGMDSALLTDASLLLIVLSAAGVVWAGAAAGLIDACRQLR